MTGPSYHRHKFVESLDSNGQRIAYTSRDYYVEAKRPFTGVNPFTMETARIGAWSYGGTDDQGNPVSGTQAPGFDKGPNFGLAEADRVRMTNNAYAKFVDRSQDSAQNANNVMEMSGNCENIMSKVKAIATSIEAARRGDIGGIAKALGVSLSGSRYQRIKKRAKQAADLWLEFHFGWDPLVKDIGNSIDILQGTGKSGGTGNGSQRTSSHSSCQVSHSDDLSYDHWPSNYQNGNDVTTISVSVIMSGYVKVTNDNLSKANQLGFTNPASVIWEAVPFSFVVDWFANVGQCLSAMTDFLGCSIINGRTTIKYTGTRSINYEGRAYSGPGSYYYSSSITASPSPAELVLRDRSFK